MYARDKGNPLIGLTASTALAVVLLTGCASNPAPRAEVSAAQAEVAIADGRHGEAVVAAESAVMAEPRNAAYRMVLGSAYLDAGRFGSAATTFQDAMALGDNSPRAALSLALALIGEGRFNEASALLGDWEGEIAASDLGLALALAGQPGRGIQILTTAIRQGDDSAKTRQNLAYAYAVDGRWRDARVMVAQDVPADQVGARIAEWAQLTSADAYQHRVAALLNVPAGVRDAGQPVQLALANNPGVEQLAAEASGYAASPAALAALDTPVAGPVLTVPATARELPAVGEPEIGLDTYARPTVEAPATFTQAFATPAPAAPSLAGVATDTMRFIANPVVQTTPVRHGAAPAAAPAARAAAPAARVAASDDTPAPRRATPRREVAAAPGVADNATHLIQLGSFTSEQGARRAWGIYVARNPELSRHEMVITEAMVRGRRYWRVSAGGFDAAGSRAMCSRVDAASGDGCITWAANSPLPGAVDTGVRFASR